MNKKIHIVQKYNTSIHIDIAWRGQKGNHHPHNFELYYIKSFYVNYPKTFKYSIHQFFYLILYPSTFLVTHLPSWIYVCTKVFEKL